MTTNPGKPKGSMDEELLAILKYLRLGRLLKRYLSYDCLVIDGAPPAGWSGYVDVEAAQVGQFFTLMHKRHKKKTTLITTNLGFSEWGSFLHNKQLTAALIDRLTENSHVINIKHGKSLRDPLDE